MAVEESGMLPKRLLHVVESFAPAAGGLSEGIRKLAASDETRPLHEVVCLDDPAEPFLQGHDFPVHALGPAHGSYASTPRLQPWLAENLERFEGVVIHGLWQFHSYGTYCMVRGRLPYAVFPHGMLDPYFKRSFPRKHLKKQLYWFVREHRVLRDARAVCFTTAAERDAAVDTFWPQRWNPAVVSFGTVAPPGEPGAQRAVFLRRYPELQGRRFFLFLSRIHRKKGCDLLIEAFARLAAAYPDLDLVMAGPDEEGLRPKLQAQAKSLGIENRVHWPGMLEGTVKWGAFHSAEAFVLPSHQENFGVAVVEALACGLPVVISDKVNIWPQIAESEAGVVQPDTAEGTYLGLTAVLELSPEARLRLVMNGLECFRTHFEMKRTAQALQEIFH